MESWHNYIDTHAYIVNNAEIYHKYFQDALDNFEKNTGFALFAPEDFVSMAGDDWSKV